MRFAKFEIIILGFLLMVSFIPTSQAPPSPITLTNIEIVTVTEDFATVTWVTNLQADTKVEWGTTEALGNEYHIDESTNYHLGNMEDLSQGTTYYFRVSSNDVLSTISNFNTLTDPGGDLKKVFAIVADPHYDVDGSNTANGNMNEDGPRLLASCVEDLNNDHTIDFVIMLGDLTNGEETDYNGYTSTMDNLNVPWFPVLGNWDKNEDNWENYYNDYFGRTETYYTIDYSGYHLVILDSSTSGQINGKFEEEQMTWLENDLDSNSYMPTMIFMHHMADRTDEFLGLEPSSQDRLLSILSQHPQVLSIYSGHIHQNILSYAGDEMNLAVASTVQYPMGYTVVKLYEAGYTQAFYKIQGELETSEESRIRINTNSGDSNADEEYLGDMNERSMEIHIPGNNPPVISKVFADPSTVRPKGTVTITVSASDPDDDTLSYNFEPSAGTILGAGEEVTWTAPDDTGECIIQVWVSDGEKSSDKDSVVIMVEGKAEGDGGDETPGFESAILILSLISLAYIFRKRKG
jgi:calcineurin-like phosphoesterase family protein